VHHTTHVTQRAVAGHAPGGELALGLHADLDEVRGVGDHDPNRARRQSRRDLQVQRHVPHVRAWWISLAASYGAV